MAAVHRGEIHMDIWSHVIRSRQSFSQETVGMDKKMSVVLSVGGSGSQARTFAVEVVLKGPHLRRGCCRRQQQGSSSYSAEQSASEGFRSIVLHTSSGVAGSTLASCPWLVGASGSEAPDAACKVARIHRSIS